MNKAMKELSIEEKAKRYDEALERARCYKGLEAEMSNVFPELKESDDDEWIKIALIKIVNDHYPLFKEIDRAKTIAWLEKQGEHKPAWSKEDEEILQGIWDEILANKHNAKECEWKTYDRFLSWLKSLRPQNTWKPSDNQMASITCAVRKMKESACYDSELVSLFNDLKKLMEE